MSHSDFEKLQAKSPAENYERYFVPDIGAPVAQNLVDAAALSPGERVLDIACGTGIVSRLALEKVGPKGIVAGLDVNPGMLAVAREAAPPGSSIQWYQAPAEAIPLPDNSFDAVLCSMGLQFFSDKAAALREVRRVLADGGRLVVGLPGPTPPALREMEGALARHVGPDAAAFVGAVFSLHDPDTLRELATAGGFGEVSIDTSTMFLKLPRPEEFLWQYIFSTPLAAVVAQVDNDTRAALQDDYSKRCHAMVRDGALNIEVGITTLTARK
jgi:ubiquinone/menaquinone biosynthesis C-methylase UbiE